MSTILAVGQLGFEVVEVVRGWFWFEGMVELVCGAVGRSCDVVDMGCRDVVMGSGYWDYSEYWLEKELRCSLELFYFHLLSSSSSSSEQHVY